MGMEVALLEWTDHERGVRLVAQTSDPTLVATVQQYFAADLQGENPEPSKELRLVKGGTNEPNDVQGEGDSDETS